MLSVNINGVINSVSGLVVGYDENGKIAGVVVSDNESGDTMFITNSDDLGEAEAYPSIEDCIKDNPRIKFTLIS